MQDTDFLSEFENCTLPKSYFTHRNHIRIAWIYLNKYPTDIAIEKITTGILRYATSLNAAHIYNETLTRAWIHLANKALVNAAQMDFDMFIETHSQLLNSKYLLQFYSEKLLFSDEAKKQWLEPDIKPFSE